MQVHSGVVGAIRVRPLFGIETAEEAAVSVIRIRGELDRSGVPRLERAFADAEATRAGQILLDLEKLTFIDAAGLYVLLTAHRRSAEHGDRLRMTSGTGGVAETFRLTTLDTMLPFVSPGPV